MKTVAASVFHLLGQGMIMRLLLVAALFAAVTISAHAGLGETREQCIARYGSPEPATAGVDSGNTLVFKKNGIEITATFEGGTCVDLSFTKEDRSDFTENEMKLLLSLNSQGFAWKIDARPTQSEGYKIVGEWTRTDGADASHGVGDSGAPYPFFFEICTKEYNDKLTAQNAADAKTTAAQKLQGF